MRRMPVFAVCLLVALSTVGCQKHLDSSGTEDTTPTTQSQAENLDEVFLSILSNEQAFYSANRKADIHLSDYRRNVSEYAFIDLDSDGQNEVAVRFDDGGIVILRKSTDSVTGFDFDLHGMYQLNKDGSFYWNENAGTLYGCSVLEFSENGCTAVELWRVEHGESDSVAYYAGGKPLSEQEFQAVSAQNGQESVIWIPWTEIQ